MKKKLSQSYKSPKKTQAKSPKKTQAKSPKKNQAKSPKKPSKSSKHPGYQKMVTETLQTVNYFN